MRPLEKLLKVKPRLSLVLGGVLTAMVPLLALSTFAVVDPGQRGVYVLLGDTREEALDPGLHWKHPLAEIQRLNVQQMVFDQKAEASSRDLQIIHTEIAVNYHPQPEEVWRLYKDVGSTQEAWEHVLLRPAIQEVTKAVTAKFTAEELIQRREEAKAAITDQIVQRLAREHILVTEVSITDFGFNNAFNDAIESKQIAEQRAKQAENELRKVEIDARQRVVTAEANKKATVLEAEAHAEQVRLLAAAEADYQTRVGATANPEAVRLRMLERWDGQMPQVVGESDLMLDLAPRRD